MRIRYWLTLLTLCTVALLSPLPSAGQTEVGAHSDTPRTDWGSRPTGHVVVRVAHTARAACCVGGPG